MFGEPAVRVYQKLRIPLRLLPTWLLVWASKGEGQCSPRKPAEQELAAEASENPLASDPWFAPTSRLHGRIDFDGHEYLESQQILDALQISMAARRASLFRRLTALMRAHNWEPISNQAQW